MKKELSINEEKVYGFVETETPYVTLFIWRLWHEKIVYSMLDFAHFGMQQKKKSYVNQ